MKRRGLGLAGLLLALLAVSAACAGRGGSAPSDSAAGAGAVTQTDNGAGSVTVEATWVTPDHLSGDEKLRAVASKYANENVVLLHVKMNTHSVDLSAYDLGTVSTLDAGGDAAPPLDWVKISDDSHHAEAVLVFRRPASTSAAALTLRDIGGVPERTLRWSPPPS